MQNNLNNISPLFAVFQTKKLKVFGHFWSKFQIFFIKMALKYHNSLYITSFEMKIKFVKILCFFYDPLPAHRVINDSNEFALSEKYMLSFGVQTFNSLQKVVTIWCG